MRSNLNTSDCAYVRTYHYKERGTCQAVRPLKHSGCMKSSSFSCCSEGQEKAVTSTGLCEGGEATISTASCLQLVKPDHRSASGRVMLRRSEALFVLIGMVQGAGDTAVVVLLSEGGKACMAWLGRVTCLVLQQHKCSSKQSALLPSERHLVSQNATKGSGRPKYF